MYSCGVICKQAVMQEQVFMEKRRDMFVLMFLWQNKSTHSLNNTSEDEVYELRVHHKQSTIDSLHLRNANIYCIKNV